jgi:hypothetical protein
MQFSQIWVKTASDPQPSAQMTPILKHFYVFSRAVLVFESTADDLTT